MHKDTLSAADKGSAKVGPSSAGLKLLQDHLLAKKRALQKQPSNLGANKKRKSVDNKQEPLHQSGANDHQQEYDPMMPNSYEAVKTEYLKSEKRRLAKLTSSTGKKLSVPHLLDVIDKLDDDADELKKSDKKNRGYAIAPPPSLSSRNPTISPDDPPDVKPLFVSSETKKADSAQSIAAKIMSKMGYKQGQGLGKDEQGISGPLEVEKSGLKQGKITMAKAAVAEMKAKRDESEPVDEIKRALEQARKESTSRVLLLQNMVAPGEVDEDLESETKEECKKYGQVVKCLIYEIPNKRVPDEEAVRIFVEFHQPESALKALNDLNGRYFGGRIVRATLYSVEKFNKYELGPS